jgi:nitrate reductase NapD
VTCVPEREDKIMSIIRDYPHTDAERGPYAGKLIVTMETERLSDVTEFLDRVERLPGVMHAAMVYHHAEPADQLDQEIELDDAGEPVSQPIGVTP